MLDRILMFFGLRREAYVQEAVKAAAQSAYQEGHNAGQQIGFVLGVARGELKGRQELAQEIEIAHGYEAGRMMEPLELATLRIRQLH